jgi:hypothetical protein
MELVELGGIGDGRERPDHSPSPKPPTGIRYLPSPPTIRATLSPVGDFVKKPVHDVLSEPKICKLQEIESVRKIQKMALRRPAENAQRPRDRKPFSTRSADPFLIVHQQQINTKLERKSDRGTLTCV